MFALLRARIFALYTQQVPATGIGLLRIFYGLVTFQEVLFLIYFNHLIFDPIPFLDVEFPMIVFFLWLWALVALALTLGYRSQQASIANYMFWLLFVNFTPMQRDFDGGFDLFMIGVNLFMIFMPLDRAFALDGLRRKWAQPFVPYTHYPRPMVSALAYYLPVLVCLGFLYFDSVIHKLFAPHWRNGLGSWLPSSMPYYVSALDWSWLLDQQWLIKSLGYLIIVFQLTFMFLFQKRWLRPLYALIGMGLHLGITLSFNIYPFGLGMLSLYTLVVPFAWYRRIAAVLTCKQPRLTVFYDAHCPLCCRTVLALNHFDVLHAVEFKAAQDHAAHYPQLRALGEQYWLKDLYALDASGNLYAGVATYARILIALRYPAIIGGLLLLPGIRQLAEARYRRIADNRVRKPCDADCAIEVAAYAPTLYQRWFDTAHAKSNSLRISKILLVLIVLQLNCSLHYGLLYRLKVDLRQSPATGALADMSNALLMLSHTFAGITPHALYLHDHFEGYDHIVALTYIDAQGREQWLPFVNEDGRMLAPNWGRVHSMWANIAVTPNIDEWRLQKFIMKVTAFWGKKLGLDLDRTRFVIRMKKISAPSEWEYGLRSRNLSGSWQVIGSAQWQGKRISIDLPDDIDAI
jgi:predicted DCC family thiol-disulfide oxidoreductase YuxK